ncbi:hypothetical protein CPB85DRAFT_1455191, partial [Mucidula mucida]
MTVRFGCRASSKLSRRDSQERHLVDLSVLPETVFTLGTPTAMPGYLPPLDAKAPHNDFSEYLFSFPTHVHSSPSLNEMSAFPRLDASIVMELQENARSDEIAILGVLAAGTVDGHIEPLLDVVRHWLSKSPSTVDNNSAHAQYSCIEAICASLVSWKKEVPWILCSLHRSAEGWSPLLANPLAEDILVPFYLSSPSHVGDAANGFSVFALEAIPVDIIKSVMPAYIHAAASSLDDVSVFTAISDVLQALSNMPFGTHPRISPLYLDILDGTSRSLRTLCSKNMVHHLKSGYERYDHIVVFVSLCGTGSRRWRRTFMAHNIMTDMISATKRFLRSVERQDTTFQSQWHGARCIQCFLYFVQELTSYEGLRGVMNALKCNIIYFLLKCDAVHGTSFTGNHPINAIFGNIRKYMVHPSVLSSVARARYHKSRPVSSKLSASCSRQTQFHWYSMMVKEAPVLETAVTKMLEEMPTFYRECANPECPSLHQTAPTKCCLGCRQVFYHSEACQRADWPNHRDACLLAAEQFLDGSFPPLSKHWKNCLHWFFRYEVLHRPRSVEYKKLWHGVADQPAIGVNDIMIVLDYSTNEKTIDIISSPYLASEFKEPSVLMRWYIPWHSADGPQRTFGEASFPISKAEGWNSGWESVVRENEILQPCLSGCELPMSSIVTFHQKYNR